MFRSVLTRSNNDNTLSPLPKAYSETFIDFRWWETQTPQREVLDVSIPLRIGHLQLETLVPNMTLA